MVATLLVAPLVAVAQEPAPSRLLAGQELIYQGSFGAAHLHFVNLMHERPDDPAPAVLAAAALVWWADAREEELWMADSVDALLEQAVARSRGALDGAITAQQRATALYWTGTTYGYRARQNELRGHVWRGAREARAMADALEEAVLLDSTCTDCRLGIAVYRYELARAGALARMVARIIGLGSGDVRGSIAAMRLVAAHGVLARIEARWVLATTLLREGNRDPAQRAEGLRLVAELAAEFPENEVFRRAADPAAHPRR
jgi:hypothetical protein